MNPFSPSRSPGEAAKDNPRSRHKDSVQSSVPYQDIAGTPRSSRRRFESNSSSPLRSTQSSSRSTSTNSASVLRPLPLSHRVVAEATRDELLALARQSRHLERHLQKHLDAQSAGLIAGLGLEDRDDASSQVGSDGRARHTHSSHGASLPQRQVEKSRHVSDTVDAVRPRPPPLPATRRAIHETLLELADLKSQEAATLNATLGPLNDFLSHATELEQKKTGLEAAIARKDTPAVRGELDALVEEEKMLEREILELEDTLATKRNRLRHVKTRRVHDTSTLDAQLSSWRQAASDVEARIRNEILAGHGLPWKDSRVPRQQVEEENVWALPAARRTLDLVKDSVEHDRAAVAEAQASARREAHAAAAGADIWQGTIGAVRGVERALRREMRRLASGGPARTSNGKAPASAAPASIPLDDLSPVRRPTPHHSVDLAASTATGSFTTARTHTTSGSTSTILPAHPQPPPLLPAVASHGDDDLADDMGTDSTGANATMRGMQSVVSHMDAAIASLAADVSLAAERGWKLLVVAIGAELAALREGRSVLGNALGEPDAHAPQEDGGDAEAIELMPTTARASSAQRHAAAAATSTAMAPGPTRADTSTPKPTQRERVHQSPHPSSPPRELARADTEDDGPSLDLLIEADDT